jgi:hypothetical protein
MSRARIEKIVPIYEPSIPLTPAVSAAEIPRSLALFPATRTPPDLAAVRLDDYVDPSFSVEATRIADAKRGPRFMSLMPLLIPVLAGAWAVFAFARRRARSKAQTP